MESGKHFLKSKTLWANMIAFVSTMFGVFGLAEIPPDQQAALATGIMAVVNIVLRFFTDKPISVKGKSGTTSMLLLMFFIVGGLLTACAVGTAETPAQKAYALAGTYEAVAIEAKTLIKTGTLPDDIVIAIGKANDIAQPAVQVLIQAAQSYTKVSEDIEAIREQGHDPPDTLIAAGQAALDELTAIFSKTRPRVQALVDAVNHAKGDDS